MNYFIDGIFKLTWLIKAGNKTMLLKIVVEICNEVTIPANK